MKTEWKRFAVYAGLPILACALLIAKRGRIEPFALLVKEVLLLWGYLLAVEDWRDQRVPNRMLGYMLGAWALLMLPQLLLQTRTALFLLLSAALGAAVGGGVFLVMYCISHRGIGGGDVKFMAAAGLYVGPLDILAATLYGSVFVAVYGLALVAMKKITIRDSVPMLPFLYLGILIRLFLQ